MEYQKIINLLDNGPNQPTKFRTKKWVEINGTQNTNSQIKFKTSMSRSILCEYSDAFILVSATIPIARVGADDTAKRLDERNKGAMFKNCTPLTDCISEINNT